MVLTRLVLEVDDRADGGAVPLCIGRSSLPRRGRESNREIASALVISERMAARHLQNIFAKLRVSSRTAATKFAFEHDLV